MRRIVVLFISLVSTTSVLAQQGVPSGGAFPLPPGVTGVVSDDAQNQLIVTTQSPEEIRPAYSVIRMKHSYSGGIAALLGGGIIPTLARVNTGGLFGGQGLPGFGGQAGGGAMFGGGAGLGQGFNPGGAGGFGGFGGTGGFGGGGLGGFGVPGGFGGFGNSQTGFGPGVQRFASLRFHRRIR